jgi:hypothetical protein
VEFAALRLANITPNSQWRVERRSRTKENHGMEAWGSRSFPSTQDIDMISGQTSRTGQQENKRSERKADCVNKLFPSTHLLPSAESLPSAIALIRSEASAAVIELLAGRSGKLKAEEEVGRKMSINQPPTIGFRPKE